MRKNGWLLIGSILFACLLAEGLLRLLVPPPRQLLLSQMETGNIASSSTQSNAGRKNLFVGTPSGRRLRPHAVNIIHHHPLNGRDITIRTNALGFRGPEIDWKLHPRILFLGDSITMQDYLPEEETFAYLIKELSRSTGSQWETLNAGIGSIGIGTERAMLEEVGKIVRPDIVVLNLYLNDVVSSPAIELVSPPGLLSRSWIINYTFQAYSTARYLIGKRDPFAADSRDVAIWKRETIHKYPPTQTGDYHRDRGRFNQMIQASLVDWGSAWSDSAMSLLLEEIKRVQRASEQLSSRLLVAIHPVSHQVDADFLADEPQRSLKQSLKMMGIRFMDLLPAQREHYMKNRSEKLFYDQCHHTPAGSRLIAETLFSFIRQSL